MKKYEFILKDLDCANCANKIKETLSKNEKLKNVNVNFNTLKLSYETDTLSKQDVEKIVQSIEPEVTLVENKNFKNKKMKKTTSIFEVIRLVIGLIIALLGIYLPLPNIAGTIILIIGYLILLYRTIKNAIKLFISSKKINENFLITISVIGAFLVGEKFEGLMVITLYEIGKILESKAINKTRKSITELMDIRPEYANLKISENESKQVSPEEVKIGDTIIIKQGEKVPIDGIVQKGSASLDTSSLTGESLLYHVREGDKVLSGSINEQGLIELEVTEDYENSTVNKILELVENATDKKAKTETFVNKASKIYTPIVTLLAILVAVLLPIINKGITYSESVYRALIFLVISCPCAIAISVPLSYFSGIGKSSKSGILIKGSDYLDALKDIKEIAFDKTGTLTKGKFEIRKIDVYDKSYNEQDILKYTVMGESFSNHPIAKSILKLTNINFNKEDVKDFKEISGRGLSYTFNNNKILIGNSDLVDYNKDKTEGTKIFVKLNDDVIGAVSLADTIKEGTKDALDKLKEKGIKIRIFTGDNKRIATRVADELEVKNVESEMLPTDKYQALQKLIKKYKNTNNKVAFVGDGINDSPVLALADIGISMGGVGSHSAIEASDVVIMTDSIDKINEAIEISKKTSKIIKQNLIFAIGVKILILILSTIGLAHMSLAVFADVGVTLITIVNTLRILR
ncbi:MAG: cadmium-translocating P-type ATPase [Clostridia bacterium]|nr:cadmium-translocating P-type ATPase [Clostridia bacterium]